jgi:hypothetical protein
LIDRLQEIAHAAGSSSDIRLLGEDNLEPVHYIVTDLADVREVACVRAASLRQRQGAGASKSPLRHDVPHETDEVQPWMHSMAESVHWTAKPMSPIEPGIEMSLSTA